jgi:Fibronectin type III domain
MKKIRNIVTTMLLLLAIHPATAQIYPIQATTQLVPPYAVYLPDYATGINNQLRVLLLNKDVTQPDYKVKLIMSIELNGSLIMRTSDTYAPGPITLQPNQPFSVEGLELAPYMNSNNIDFIGYSRQDYEQKKGLPEGAYKICFTAYDYFRPDRIKVSNDGCSFYYLTKNDPPFVNMPACGLYIAPHQDEQENLIDRAGRWLSYTIDMPWDDTEKNIWYDHVEEAITQTFSERVNNAIAKDKLYETGMNYAIWRNKHWDAAYGKAWASLVFKELTDNEFIYWSRTKLKTGAEQYIVTDYYSGGGLYDGGIDTYVDLQTYIEVAPAGNATINFMWTPRHTSSPNSTLTTRYKIELYEVRPKVPNEQLPAMANNAVLTSPPVFTDETDVTTYTYGADKPALIDGLQYAWRIKAFDAGGRDWFKNNGYSEVCYFTFGGVYNPNTNPPGLEEINTFNAQAETERRGLGQWQQTGGYTSYRVRYRRKNGSGTWFDVDTDSLNAKLYDLEPSTAYQAQVQGKAGQYYGPFSPIKEFITPALTPPPGCGLPITYASGLSNEPLPILLPFMIIKCGKFEMLVDSVAQPGSPGYYSGSGRIFNIPFLNIIQVMGALMGNENTGLGTGLKVTYNNIFINKDREVTQGLIYAVTRPLEEWVAEFGAFYGADDEEKQQKENQKKFAWLDSTAVMISFDKNYTEVKFDTANHILTMIGEDGKAYTYTLKPEEIGKNLVINTPDGNQWVVNKNGTVELAKGGGINPNPPKPLSNAESDILKLALVKLKAKYTNDTLNLLQSKSLTEKTKIENRTTATYTELKGTAPATGTDISEVYEIGVVNTSIGNSSITATINNSYETAVLNYNVGRVCRLFARETNSRQELDMVGAHLKVNTLPYKTYVAQKLATNVPNDTIAADVAVAIEQLIKTTIQSKK